MVNYWLFKEEPTHYSYDELVKDKKTVWEGVHNPLALKYLRQVRKGDQIFYYHTGSEKAVVGIMQAVSDPYSAPKEEDPRYVAVDVAPVRRLPRPVPLAAIKANPKLRNLPLVKLPRLSVMPVSPAEWQELERMGK